MKRLEPCGDTQCRAEHVQEWQWPLPHDPDRHPDCPKCRDGEQPWCPVCAVEREDVA